MLGDWEITLSGNVFTERDRAFFIDLMNLVHRRGFNSFVHGLKVSNYGADPRYEQLAAEDIPGRDFLLEQISKGIQEGLSS